MTKNNAFGGEKQNKKSNGEQSDLCDLEQVTLKPQLQVHHYLTTWLQIWYHSLLWGDSIRKGADLEKQNCLFGVHLALMGKLTSPNENQDCVNEFQFRFREKNFRQNETEFCQKLSFATAEMNFVHAKLNFFLIFLL